MSTKLVLDFADAEGSNVRFSYSYVDPDVTSANVRALVNTILTNATLFEKEPTIAKTATLVTTTETDISLV